MKNKKKHRIRQPFRALLPIAVWLLVWLIAAMVVNKTLLIPKPIDVLVSLKNLAATAMFWKTAGMTLLRIIIGTAVGTVAGCVLAVLTECSEIADAAVSPAIRLIRATPVASFIILLLLWFAKTRVPAVVSCLVVIPIVWENVRTGIEGTDPLLLEMAHSYSFGRLKTWRYIYIPSVKPHLMSGISNALGLAWKSGVAAEVLCSPKLAIGTQIYNSKLYLETAELFAWTIVVIILSMIFEKIIKKLIIGDYKA
ncbi:MAG: ABC transporter permease subunit [Lachnospiraceae bacterium]|nr:ABC transporter permease subunit [Lachnospiraceae bacterium]